MPQALTVDEYEPSVDDLNEVEAAAARALDDHDLQIGFHRAVDKIAQEVPFASDPRVFLAARDAALEVIYFEFDDAFELRIPQDAQEKAIAAARKAARPVASRLLRQRLIRATAHTSTVAVSCRSRPRMRPRERRVVRVGRAGARGSPSSDSDPPRRLTAAGAPA